MSLKRFSIIGLLLLSGIISPDHSYRKTWLSNIDSLNSLEQIKFDAMRKDCSSLYATIFDEAFCSAIKPAWTRCLKACESWDHDNAKKTKKSTDQLSHIVKQDQQLTSLVKHMAEVFDGYFIECVNCKTSLDQQMLDVFLQYLPEKIDLTQVYIDYGIWGYEYLESRLHKKGSLKVDDVSYVMQQYVYYIKQQIPFSTLFSLKKSYEMWMGFVSAFDKGMKDQPSEVSRYFIEQLELVLKDADLKSYVTSIKEMNQLRQDIVKLAAKGKSVDQKLKEYEAVLDKAVVCMNKFVSKYVGKNKVESKFVTMAEKLLFVS